jgi:DNA (cytosine-5)-methyltransferase 1
MSKPTVVSLFTGAGGLDLGFHAAGLRTAVAVEMDADCCVTLRKNKSKQHPWEVIEAKVEDVSSPQLLEAGRLAVGEADLLIGGPPCQPFSKSGYWARGDSGRLKDPRANTLREYLRVLEDLRPRAFLLENVSGLAYTGKEEGFTFLIKEIEKINARTGTRYRVSHQVLNAANFGVPQTRERILLVGSRDGTEFRFPEPSFFDPEEEPMMAAMHSPWRTAWDALGDETPDDLDETKVSGRWADLLPTIPEGLNYNFHTDRGEGRPLFGWRRRYWSFLLKLRKSRPSWTITAQPGPAIGPFHWDSRRLSRRELMRIQTFPETYEIHGSIADVQRQVGNAVPSLLGEVVALEIRRQLLGHKPKAGSPSLLPQRRNGMPAEIRPAPVPQKYLHLIGDHEAHPGTGLGHGAIRRRESAA